MAKGRLHEALSLRRRRFASRIAVCHPSLLALACRINTVKRVAVAVRCAMQTRAQSRRCAASELQLGQLALLLERVATELPPLVLVIVLRPLPAVELARMACVHKAYWLVLVQLREEHPGSRYAKPTEAIEYLPYYPRLCRAAGYGDVAVLGSMIEAGVNECGVSLQHNSREAISRALANAADGGYLDAVELLIRAGADVHYGGESPPGSHMMYALFV
jgi:hypothetical protein